MKKTWMAIALSALASVTAPGAESRPFPCHAVYAKGSLKPARPQRELDAAVLDFYRAWKARYVRPAANGAQRYVACNVEGQFHPKATCSISEGHGYGMLALVTMAGADREVHADFDAMVRFWQAHPSKEHPPLMAWRQSTRAGEIVDRHEDRDSATDGDLDIALALLMADRQWGSAGAVNYRREAGALLRAIREAETDAEAGTLALGDWVDARSSQRGSLRSSDFMPAHLKAFAAVEGDPVWARVTDSTYRIFADLTAHYAKTTGLLPDFIERHGAAYRPARAGFLEGADDGAFAYNACRVPWRLGVDGLLTGDPRARALLAPLNAWAERVCGGDPARFNAGYKLDGTPLKEDGSAAFIGPLAVAAMNDPARQRWLDALWGNLLARQLGDEGYYGNTVKLMTMLVVSGNWWQP